MRVRLISTANLRELSRDLTGKTGSFENFIALLNKADWYKPGDITEFFPSARTIGEDRVVFKLCGNKIRLICKYHFGIKFVHLFICFVGTHKEYDQLCKDGSDPNQFTVWMFK